MFCVFYIEWSDKASALFEFIVNLFFRPLFVPWQNVSRFHTILYGRNSSECGFQ